MCVYVCVFVCVCACTQFVGCDMTLETIATLTLSNMPHWTRRLSFVDCTWPERPAAYKLFAYNIPTTYSEWVLSGGHSREVAESLCMGAAQQRKKSGLRYTTIIVRSDTVNISQGFHYGNCMQLLPAPAL